MSIYLFNLLTERVLYTLASNHKVSLELKKKNMVLKKRKKEKSCQILLSSSLSVRSEEFTHCSHLDAGVPFCASH